MRRVGAGIITRNGKILIAQRPEGKALAGLWEFPGGKIEEGETIEECLQREIWEELGIKSQVDNFFMKTLHSYPDGEFCIEVFFVKIADDAELKMNVHQDLRWVEVMEMKNYSFPDADVEIIENLQKIAI